MNLVVKGVTAFLITIYPLVIYFGLEHFEARYMAIFLALILLLRFLSGSSIQGLGNKKQHIIITIITIVVLMMTLKNNALDGLKIYPVIVSFSFLVLFAYSLFKPPSIIERIARLQEPDLPEKGVIYTRNVTKIWCMFFLINGVIALYTAFFTSIAVWTLYNGLISYLIMGSLFAGEFIFRKIHLQQKPE